MKAVLGIDRIMIKCPKFTNNIGSGSFIDTFCQKQQISKTCVCVWGVEAQAGATAPQPLLDIPLAAHSIFKE